MRRHAQRLAQHAVHAHAHDEAGFIRLDVDIADTLARGFGDDPIDEADGRGVVAAVEQVLRRGQVACNEVQIVAAHGEGAGHRRGRTLHRVMVGKIALERGLIDDGNVETAR